MERGKERLVGETDTLGAPTLDNVRLNCRSTESRFYAPIPTLGVHLGILLVTVIIKSKDSCI